ncbi:DEKNAAC104016 [Brettanomyces naardenensis]|uniref:Large ribosomal subunit protein mL67 n=1 Tax=Brettanomyces naardenensis TaxID=13370 RepID=A0A448YQ42_BRENA|nr:DEKNAAC104016 [Brettanomyces naardenensis]
MSTKFRNAHWLKTNGFAPQVYLFRNIESGQVIYSQIPHVNNYQIKQQFFRPNWENKKPSKRRDLWRPMAVAEFEDYQRAIQAYHGLVELRYMREVSKRKEAEALRRRNEYQQIWYSGQYRPTWSQEAASDLSAVVDEFQLKTKIYWDTLWRKGDDKRWNEELVEHVEMDQVSPRDKLVVLDEIREEGLRE